jgi:hypothetical protein
MTTATGAHAVFFGGEFGVAVINQYYMTKEEDGGLD